jgi:hypothetical protein
LPVDTPYYSMNEGGDKMVTNERAEAAMLRSVLRNHFTKRFKACDEAHSSNSRRHSSARTHSCFPKTPIVG